MARNPLISERRFKTILKRQEEMKWRAEYQPAMLATRDEAPRNSRPSTLYWAKLGRDLHFMSLAERHVCLLALYHPRVFDIHEQHMLHRFETPHPLASYPGASRQSFPPLEGTVTIAQQLGVLSKHPVILITDKNDTDNSVRHGFPYLGDLLIFLRDDQGPYAVNWSVKATRNGFYARNGSHIKRKVVPPVGFDPLLSDRHALEIQYFSNAKIPTHLIAADELNFHLIHNLNTLCAKAQRPETLPYEVEEQLIHTFQNIVDTRTTVLSLLDSLKARFNCERDDLLATFYRAIWNRRLRLDLYMPVLVDKPLRGERSDVLKNHAHFFGRY